MELMKEAIFTDEEQELILEIIGGMITHEKEVTEKVIAEEKERFDKHPMVRMARSFANNTKDDEISRILDDIITESEKKSISVIKKKTNLASSIITKMHLYKNCVLNNE